MWVQFALLLKVIFELERRIPKASMNETKARSELAQKPDRGSPEKKSHMWPSPIHAAAAKMDIIELLLPHVIQCIFAISDLRWTNECHGVRTACTQPKDTVAEC